MKKYIEGRIRPLLIFFNKALSNARSCDGLTEAQAKARPKPSGRSLRQEPKEGLIRFLRT